jgi:hypothetical protein
VRGAHGVGFVPEAVAAEGADADDVDAGEWHGCSVGGCGEKANEFSGFRVQSSGKKSGALVIGGSCVGGGGVCYVEWRVERA